MKATQKNIDKLVADGFRFWVRPTGAPAAQFTSCRPEDVDILARDFDVRAMHAGRRLEKKMDPTTEDFRP